MKKSDQEIKEEIRRNQQHGFTAVPEAILRDDYDFIVNKIKQSGKSIKSNENRALIGYRSGSHEAEMWKNGVDKEKLGSNSYPEKVWKGVYCDPNRGNIGNYGDQKSEVYVKGNPKILRIEGGLDVAGNRNVIKQIKAGKSALGKNTVIHGIVSLKNDVLNGVSDTTQKSNFERIIPKDACKKVIVCEASNEIVKHPAAPTHSIRESTKKEKQLLIAKSIAKTMAKSAVVQAGTHVADHYAFKDATLNHNECVESEVYHYDPGSGSAMARFRHTQAGTLNGDFGVKAYASASVAYARAQSEGIPYTGGLAAAFAEAEAPNAKANSEASVMGVRASANASVAEARVGFEGTPIQASASGPSAGANAGFHANHIGASIGAHAAEVSAGPFAARAGIKIGAGIENGVPVVHAGPVSCIVM